MTDPRDFLPAKYNKTQKDKSVFPPTDLKAENQSSKIDSPWADLAKEPKIPTYRNAVDSSNNNNNDQVGDEKNSTTAFSDKFLETTNQTSTFTPKRKSNSKLAGLLVVFFLVIGVFSSYLLTQQNQDGRQQASGGEEQIEKPPIRVRDEGEAVKDKPVARFGDADEPYPTFNFDTRTITVPTPASPIDLSNLPIPTVNDALGTFGQCVGDQCKNTLKDFENPAVLIRGTYPCASNTGRCLVGGTGAQATAKAAIDFGFKIAELVAAEKSGSEKAEIYKAINNGALNIINHNDYNGVDKDGNPLYSPAQLIPYIPCGGITEVSCEGDGGGTATVGTGFTLVATYGDEAPDGQFIFITPEEYARRLAAGENWVPTGVGGVNYPHFTTCTDQGSGVDLIGCGVELPKDDGDGDNTPKPPSTTTIPPSTTTIPPTVTTTAPTPICSNIEMLDSTGNIMTADDDEKLKNGDQVKFRASAANASSSVITYEFRLMAPNTTAWQNITNTSAGAAAANVSAAYAIISSGHHIVQARICVSGVCQAWENVDISETALTPTPSVTTTATSIPSTTATATVSPTTTPTIAKLGERCGTISGNVVACESGTYCSSVPAGGCSIINGQQTRCATAPYCLQAEGLTCSTNVDCFSGYSCYQPPMPSCPAGQSCIQVMPAKYCKSN